MQPESGNLRGALFMMAAMAGFVFNDALMKQVLAEIPLFTAIFWRGLVMIAVLAVWCALSGAWRWRPTRGDGLALSLRMIGEVGATLTFLTALTHMPIANVSAILQSAPLAVTLAAALFLGEKVGWRRGVALVIGFLGVLLIVRPGTSDFSIHALLAVVATLMIVLRDLATRRLSPATPSVLVALITSVCVTLTGALGAGASGLILPPGPLLGLTVAAGAVLILGYIFSVMAMRVGEIAFVSPFRYTVLIWALILGVLVFDEFPDGLTLLGSAIVVATGIFTFYREHRARRPGGRAATTVPAAATRPQESG